MSPRPLKSNPDKVATNVRLDPEVHTRLRQECNARMVSIQMMIERAVIEFLDRLVPLDEMTGKKPNS